MTQKLPQICTAIFVSVLGRLRDLHYILAVTSGSHSIAHHQSRPGSLSRLEGRQNHKFDRNAWVAVLVQSSLHIIHSPWFRYIPHHQRRQRIAREEEEGNQQQQQQQQLQQLQQLQEQACRQLYVYESNYVASLCPKLLVTIFRNVVKSRNKVRFD